MPGKKLTAKQIFDNSRKNLKDDMEFVNEFFLKLSRSISLIINLIDPDALVFGGGLSNELGSLDKIKKVKLKEEYMKRKNQYAKIDNFVKFKKMKSLFNHEKKIIKWFV